MSLPSTTRIRKGFRHGDVSYVTLALPDLARGQAFYGAVLGWRFSPGSGEHGAQVDDVVPMVGLTDAGTTERSRPRHWPGTRRSGPRTPMRAMPA